MLSFLPAFHTSRDDHASLVDQRPLMHTSGPPTVGQTRAWAKVHLAGGIRVPYSEGMN